MANDQSKEREASQPVDPETLAWWAYSLRTGSGWSQETVAELSGLNVRTVQRVEAGHPSNVHTRRALARGLGYEDVEVFNKLETSAYLEKLRADIFQMRDDAVRRTQFPDCIFVDAVEAKNGKMLADFAESISAWNSDHDDKSPRRAKEIFCSLVDYITDYGETAELCSQSLKLNVHAELEDSLGELSREGYGFYFASRPTKVTNESWKDQRPLRITFGYMRLLPTGKERVQFAIPSNDRLM